MATTIDPNAVEVYLEGTACPLGYVPSTHSKLIVGLLERDRVKNCEIFRVGTDQDGHWRVSMRVTYEAENSVETRIEGILKQMQVPSREYARLIANTTKPGSESERSWIEAYNDTCFE